MKTRDELRLDGLEAFLAVARTRSFRAAAKALGVTPGAVSQRIQGLERRVATPLFARTTRSVALTEAGATLFERVAPAATSIREAFAALDARGDEPSGTLRITVPRLAVPFFVTPAIERLRASAPRVAIEVSVDDAFVDLQRGGFDAGIRVGESIAKDMVAVRLSPPLRWCVVGAPSYFARHGHPASWRDLLRLPTIRYRRAGTNEIYAWELEERGRAFTVDVSGPITVNDGELGLELARRGLGLLYTADLYIARDLERRSLATTLDASSPSSAGFFLYFASGAQAQPKLGAFVACLRALARESRARPRRAPLRRA